MRIVSAVGVIVVAWQAAAVGACSEATPSRDARLQSSPARALAGASAAPRAGSGSFGFLPPGGEPPRALCAPENLCRAAAIFQADIPAAIDVARHWTFQACRNDDCWSTRDNPDDKVSSGRDDSGRSAIWLYLSVDVPPLANRPSFMLSKVEEGALFLEVTWSDDAHWQDGDRIVIHAQEPSGERHDLIEERATYQWAVEVLGGCGYSCRRARVDRRAPMEADAGM
ncbi:MAG TPA: hypothetical protein VJV78_39865 [Polyangiales bacterium]|nr:hypothetical protein [Polyangiales bacterium]